jgi:transposase
LLQGFRNTGNTAESQVAATGSWKFKINALAYFSGTLLEKEIYLTTDWASNILRDYVGVAVRAYLKHQDTENVWASGTQIHPVSEIPIFSSLCRKCPT